MQYKTHLYSNSSARFKDVSTELIQHLFTLVTAMNAQSWNNNKRINVLFDHLEYYSSSTRYRLFISLYSLHGNIK